MNCKDEWGWYFHGILVATGELKYEMSICVLNYWISEYAPTTEIISNLALIVQNYKTFKYNCGGT